MVNPSASFWRGRRVLVTGHTGFKGAWMWQWLLELGARPIGLALPPPTEPSLFGLAGLDKLPDSYSIDIRDSADVLRVMKRAEPEIVIHMAAQSLVRRSYEQPIETYATNVMGTIHVLDAVRQTPSVGVAIIITSDKCYENQDWPWAYREVDPMGGYDPYSSSKGCVELVTSAWRRSYSDGRRGAAAVASARAGNVIGGGDWAVDRLIPDCVRAFTNGRKAAIRNPGAVRPWQHVLEPLAGYLILAERMMDDRANFADAWNFGPGDDGARPVDWLVSRLASHWGEDATWVIEPDERLHEAAVLRVDATKAHVRLGWRSRLDLERALAWTAQWYRQVTEGVDAATLCRKQIYDYSQLG